MRKKPLIEMILIFLLAVLLLGVFLFYQGGKGSGDPENDTPQEQTEKSGIVIGVTLASEDFAYQKELGDMISEFAAREEDCELKLCYAEWDTNVQIEQMREFIDEKVDAVILSPVNAKSLLNVLKETSQAGIPVINVNMKVDMVSSEYITTYVGASTEEEAELAAQMAVDYFDGNSGKVGVIEGAPGSSPQIDRNQVFLERIASYPNIEVVGIVNGKWSRSMAGLAALDLLNKNPQLDMIYCHDSNMAMGAYDMLKSRGKEKDIKVIGIGNSESDMQAVKDGRLYGIVSQPVDYEAYYALVCARKAISGSSLRPWYKNTVEIITRENVDKYKSPMEGESLRY